MNELNLELAELIPRLARERKYTKGTKYKACMYTQNRIAAIKNEQTLRRKGKRQQGVWIDIIAIAKNKRP